jgi:hypothetical protein
MVGFDSGNDATEAAAANSRDTKAVQQQTDGRRVESMGLAAEEAKGNGMAAKDVTGTRWDEGN